MKDNIQDLVKNVIGSGFFEKIKVTADAKTATLEAVEKDKEVILKGSFTSPITGLEGEFGLSNLSLLSHIANDPEFNSPDTNMDIVYAQKNGEKVPSELAYVNKSNTYINYRFMPKELVPNQPKFVEPQWDVLIKPSKSNIQQFAWAASGLSAYEQYFIPKIKDGRLIFFIGEDDAASQRGGVTFAENRNEKFDSQYKWRINHMQTVLKLADNADCDMAFSNKGVIQVKLSTGVGEYRFLFPAKVR